jgi:hypothetical protein
MLYLRTLFIYGILLFLFASFIFIFFFLFRLSLPSLYGWFSFLSLLFSSPPPPPTALDDVSHLRWGGGVLIKNTTDSYVKDKICLLPISSTQQNGPLWVQIQFLYYLWFFIQFLGRTAPLTWWWRHVQVLAWQKQDTWHCTDSPAWEVITLWSYL